MSKIAVTCGDVNGIGLEISLKAFEILSEKNFGGEIIFITPKNIYEKALSVFNTKIREGFLSLDFIDDAKLEIGKPTKIGGSTAFASVMRAYELISQRKADAMVTAPISKDAFATADIKYKGHTDLLADLSETKNYLMTFISEKFKTALATIHEPLKNVPRLITQEKIYAQLKLLVNTARNDFAIDTPKIAVLGLNPHAGENGLLGSEEKEIIVPVIERLRAENVDVAGAFVPDAFFAKRGYEKFDFVFGMYHDQVLIPFKMLNFNNGVNFTAGLPFVRTSPDHGTAYDIAWRGIADETSMLAAIELAEKIVRNRNAVA
jgi:4-hydroxythreonine-4-phosphate dehydrogenase